MGCPDPNAIVQFVDGQMVDRERALLMAHLDGCEACLSLVAAVAGGSARRAEPANALVRASLAKGTPIGRYLVLELVGRGGMGEVYAAYDPKLNRRIALKLLNERAASPVSAARLAREAQAIARLSHPNVVAIYDAGEYGDRLYLAMEFVEGQTLGDWLRESPRTWAEIRNVFAASGAGLAAAHEAGLVHRDFKPQNVMVGVDGSVRVMDFGLATDVVEVEADQPPSLQVTDATTLTNHTRALTRSGTLVGTPLYMAPEQFLGRPTDARTDQFSFCVALYESLYGERPFPADSFSELAEAVVAGRVRDPVQKGRVPLFLRRLVARGLKADPRLRFPSMQALLEVLRYDPARRRRWAAAGAGVAALATCVAVAGQRFATRGERMCRDAGDKLAGIWTIEGTGGRRQSIRTAFLATRVGFAEPTWNRVSALLDEYSRQWNAIYTDACEATHVRGDQSAQVLDLRMACLEGGRRALEALTSVLGRADSSVIVEAINAAHALPELDRCSDVTALQAPVPPPRNPNIRARLPELRSKLAEFKALIDTGQASEARRQLGPLAEAAAAIDYEPFTAEVLSAQAWLEGQSGAPADAVKMMEKAAWSGLAAHRDDIALEAVAGLVAYDGYFLGRSDESNRWALLGGALLRRLGPGHDRVAAWFYQGRAIARERRAEYAEALADLERALSLKQNVLPPQHPDLALTLHTMANVYNEMGRPQDALLAASRAVEVDESAYGAESPLLAKSLLARGESLGLLGRHSEAERDLRRAVDLSTAWVGPDHPWTAYALTGLGKTLVAEGRWREATSVLRRALRTRTASEPNPEAVAETQFALAQALSRMDRERPAAKKLAIAAGDVYRKLPNHERQVAEIEAWLRREGS
jgi:tetratricopeptide (TPR) repeat protein/tRNA A-37 threonylcarbamoyl transferase component Bud32